MKNKFSWAIPLSDKEEEDIFHSAIITFDTNVLLDLYRIDKDARDELKKSIESFKDRIWLTHQVASEFIKNKNKVSDDSSHIFSKYISEIKDAFAEAAKVINNCKQKYRTDNESILNQVTTLLSDLTKLENESSQKLQELQANYTKELTENDIFNWVFDTFNGKVGENFTDMDMTEREKKAEKRITAKIPPGYKDSDKEGKSRYGDIFLWMQILEKAKSDKKPIIFITGEKKEDWFEILSQRKAMPRHELMKEAYDVAQQKIFIYTTERFIEKRAIYIDGTITPNAEKAIKEIKNLRLHKENKVQLIRQIGTFASKYTQKGTLEVCLNEALSYFTVSGKLYPSMLYPPKVYAEIINAPDDLPQKKTIKYGTGTAFNFNIHCISNDFGVPFPKGNYIINYEANCPETQNPHSLAIFADNEDRPPDGSPDDFED
jgi:predicted nucleic acid-binding protein